MPQTESVRHVMSEGGSPTNYQGKSLFTAAVDLRFHGSSLALILNSGQSITICTSSNLTLLTVYIDGQEVTLESILSGDENYQDKSQKEALLDAAKNLQDLDLPITLLLINGNKIKIEKVNDGGNFSTRTLSITIS